VVSPVDLRELVRAGFVPARKRGKLPSDTRLDRYPVHAVIEYSS
jgi:hypothetical protein